MKKNNVFLLEMLAIVLAFGSVLTGCDPYDKDPPSGQFTVTIQNNSSYAITAYKVHTEAGLGSAKYTYTYRSAGFINDDGRDPNYRDPDVSYIDKPAINIGAGTSSENLGPFKIAFREDKANGSIVGVTINYFDGSTTKFRSWFNNSGSSDGYRKEQLPNNISLSFDGSRLTGN